MKAYRQTDLFNLLLSAASNPQLRPDPALQQLYNKKRFAQAMRALRSRNVFLYTDGTRTSTDLNNTNTIYTQPVGERLLLLGYADNFRYGAVTAATVAGPNPADAILLNFHRVRIVGPNGDRALVQDFVPAQAGVSGQPRYTSTQLVAPTIIEANEQVAVDLGYDAAGSPAPANVPPEAFIFFALKVKDKLTQLDKEAIKDIQRHIANHWVQHEVHLNCNKLGEIGVGLDATSAAGATVVCETPPAETPTLITGIGTTLGASKLTIADTADGSSFSLNRNMQSSALNFPGYENSELAGKVFGAPVVGPNWQGYYQLPVPHLLIRGAQLRAQIINGGDIGAGPNTVTETGVFNQLIFAGVTV